MNRSSNLALSCLVVLTAWTAWPVATNALELEELGQYQEPNSEVVSPGTLWAGPECFSTRVDRSGLLRLEAASPISSGAPVSLEIGDASSREASALVLTRYLGGAILWVPRAAELSYCVVADDPEDAVGAFQLINRFSGLNLFNDDRDEDEPDPDPRARSDDRDEDEPDPDPLGMDGGREWWRSEVCRSRDDHGDSILCASPLAVGSSVWGRIDVPTQDLDVFAVVTRSVAIARIKARGSVALGLYDHHGNLLAKKTRSEEPVQLIRKRLGPGRYYVRVESDRTSDYQLGLSLQSK